jgi:PadR family transcriptional regulator
MCAGDSDLPRSRNHQQGPINPRLHGEMLSTSLLANLQSRDAYGYQLAQRLSESGLPQFDSATVYRTLRQLDRTGLVASFWDTSESGPARRMYSLTKAGEMFLAGWIEVLQNYQKQLLQALSQMTPPPGLEEENDDAPRKRTRRASSTAKRSTTRSTAQKRKRSVSTRRPSHATAT